MTPHPSELLPLMETRAVVLRGERDITWLEPMVTEELPRRLVYILAVPPHLESWVRNQDSLRGLRWLGVGEVFDGLEEAPTLPPQAR